MAKANCFLRRSDELIASCSCMLSPFNKWGNLISPPGGSKSRKADLNVVNSVQYYPALWIRLEHRLHKNFNLTYSDIDPINETVFTCNTIIPFCSTSPCKPHYGGRDLLYVRGPGVQWQSSVSRYLKTLQGPLFGRRTARWSGSDRYF